MRRGGLRSPLRLIECKMCQGDPLNISLYLAVGAPGFPPGLLYTSRQSILSSALRSPALAIHATTKADQIKPATTPAFPCKSTRAAPSIPAHSSSIATPFRNGMTMRTPRLIELGFSQAKDGKVVSNASPLHTETTDIKTANASSASPPPRSNP